MQKGEIGKVIEEHSTGQVQTRLLRAGDPAAVHEAAAWLRRGFPVVFPTDTVYGIGTTPYEAAAIDRLYAVKGRPTTKGIPILLADPAALDAVAGAIPPLAHALIARFWPGPLTLIVPRTPHLPDAISPNDNIAVRIPDHDITRALIREAGGAVATTSANLSGQPPFRNGTAAMTAFNGLVPVVLDDGPSPGDQPSTIIDCTTATPQIVRVGPISAADLGLDDRALS